MLKFYHCLRINRAVATLKKPTPLSYHKNTTLHQTYFKHKNGLMDIVMVFIRESYLIVFATFQRLLSPAADGNVFLTHTNNSASDGILNKNVNCCPALCLGARHLWEPRLLQDSHTLAVNQFDPRTKSLTSGSATAAAPWTSAVPQLENWHNPGNSSESKEERLPSTPGTLSRLSFTQQLHRISFEKNKRLNQLAPR